jgi:hypothetical protein
LFQDEYFVKMMELLKRENLSGKSSATAKKSATDSDGSSVDEREISRLENNKNSLNSPSEGLSSPVAGPSRVSRLTKKSLSTTKSKKAQRDGNTIGEYIIYFLV